MIACDDNGNHAVLVEHDNSDSYALAVDWIHGLLFWADFELNNLRKINVMDLNTKQRKVLFKNLVRPEFIAVDPSKGLIFWSDRGRIERASMDGNDRMTIANSSSSFRIALDIFNERVYLIYSKTIASVDYNGNDWRTILLSDTHIKQPMSLAMFEEKLYWADFDQHGVFVMNKFNGTEIRKLISGVRYPLAVRVYHSAVQPELPNKCDQHSCGDDAICLPKGNSFDNEGKPQPRIGLPYTCVCADGYKTGEEPNTCVLGDDPILLISNDKTIYQYDLSTTRNLKLIDNLDISGGAAMDYWLKDSTIIWSDATHLERLAWKNSSIRVKTHLQSKIYMCNYTKNLQFPIMIACDDNGNRSVLVEHNNSYSIDLAVDWIHGLLFWTDVELDAINVMDLNTKQRKILFNVIESPRAIAVDPSKGLIFWIDGILGYHPGRRIWRASMDGNDRMTIANSYGANFIALDIFDERVYWADYATKTIASVDYNGNDERDIIPSNTYTDTKKRYWTIDINERRSLTIFEEKLYWTDWGGVFVMNKFNGTEVRKLISVNDPHAVRFYHSSVQPELPNKCDQHSCGDDAICLPKGNSFDNEGKPQPRIGLPYTCVCADGYKTGEEPNTCVLGDDPILLIITDKTIYQYDLSTSRKLKLIDDLNELRVMDYWLKGSINVMDLSTKQRKVLFNKDIVSPRDIAVDPSKGLIFWIDYSRRRIERASMDGNDRMTIASKKFKAETEADFEDESDFWFTNIALDIFNERVYWADTTNTIASVDYNGNDWRNILHSRTHIENTFSLAIFEEKLYWTDWSLKSVFVMNKFNGTEVRKFESTIVLFNQNFQTSVINILAAMVPYAFQKAILPWGYLIHVFVLMDTRQD
uniref:EGF-like domain-containing protein n=1 Tax=Acrobeloides nanus TaxID=290746 RepID=A0A914EMH1_9BILA